ncbi:hypothetical protein CPB84DRAFT_1756235 [Gymnopilus junonius]|uniref:Uncharacterized protein n=1 Tax=Gymnopilus junonius TaxID=109634 RepID=A0A9P5TFA3_GYMJU|nr:hypothetical protein CPB84DRAFT_1756235 [Gymnopilus junonius]
MDDAPEPRRSGHHRTGNKVTATKENAIPSTTTRGSKGTVTKTSKKSSTGKLREVTQETPKTSKRKAKQNMSDSTRKKPKVEMNDPHKLLVQDAQQLLVPMLDIMKVIIEEFPGYSNEKWYKHLVVRMTPGLLIFTYWHMYPLALPADAQDPREALNTNDPQKVKFTVNREAFISICQTINTLQCTMPEFYSSHDKHLQGFLDAILADFPHNRDDYEWHKEQAPAQDIPLSWCPAARYNGMPVFFVQLAGTHLSIGGGFCDAKNKPPVILQFGGQTNLQQDFIGTNYIEGVKKLWALRQALQLIPCELDTVDSQHEEMDIPRFRVGDKIQVTKTLFPGIIYLVKSHWEGHQRNIEDKLVLKIIYSRVAKERYGRVIQDHLSSRDMAPPCYQRFR